MLSLHCDSGRLGFPPLPCSEVLVDHLGWVLMWLGLWYPLDQFLFYPLAYGGENRALRLLAEAEVSVLPYEPAADRTGAQLGSES